MTTKQIFAIIMIAALVINLILLAFSIIGVLPFWIIILVIFIPAFKFYKK